MSLSFIDPKTLPVNESAMINMSLPIPFKVIWNDMGIVFEPIIEKSYVLQLENRSSAPIVFPSGFKLLSITATNTNLAELRSCYIRDPQTGQSYVYPPSKPYDFI